MTGDETKAIEFGTWFYNSPESISHGRIGYASDIFAFSVIIYEVSLEFCPQTWSLHNKVHRLSSRCTFCIVVFILVKVDSMSGFPTFFVPPDVFFHLLLLSKCEVTRTYKCASTYSAFCKAKRDYGLRRITIFSPMLQQLFLIWKFSFRCALSEGPLAIFGAKVGLRCPRMHPKKFWTWWKQWGKRILRIALVYQRSVTFWMAWAQSKSHTLPFRFPMRVASVMTLASASGHHILHKDLWLNYLSIWTAMQELTKTWPADFDAFF